MTDVEFETADVETLKVAVDAPGFTVTDAGTVALAPLVLRDTNAPLAPALPVNVTVPVAMFPP